MFTEILRTGTTGDGGLAGSGGASPTGAVATASLGFGSSRTNLLSAIGVASN